MTDVSGIDRRQSVFAVDKSAHTFLAFFLVSFSLAMVGLALGSIFLADAMDATADPWAAPGLAAVLRAEWDHFDADASDLATGTDRGVAGGYGGVRACFCRVDWARYKRDPPSLPMFKMLVNSSSASFAQLRGSAPRDTMTLQKLMSAHLCRQVEASGCDRPRPNFIGNVGFGHSCETRAAGGNASPNSVRILPSTGFVFHK